MIKEFVGKSSRNSRLTKTNEYTFGLCISSVIVRYLFNLLGEFWDFLGKRAGGWTLKLSPVIDKVYLYSLIVFSV